MQFHCPTRIVTGPDALDILKTFHAKRVLVVTDQFFAKSGKALEIGQRVSGAQVEIFDQVVPDPPAELAARGAALCERLRPELLIALGGGSPMDCAKGIRLASSLPMTFAAIPTTSGSGSEVTSFSILTHNGVKHAVVDEALRPDWAILDESLLAALPPNLIADTGMDLLTHCLEAAAARNRSGITDALAFYAAGVTLQNLAASWQGDRSVWGRLHEAAAMAGMAFDNAGLGLCHAMAHVLGGALHLPHGRLCAMLLPPVMAVNTAALEQYARLARACGLGGATDRLSLRNLTGAIVRLRTALQMPGTLRQAGVTQLPDWNAVAREVLKDPCCETNPVPVTEALVLQVLKAVGA